MKMKVISFFLSLVICLSMSIPAMATGTDETMDESMLTVVDSDVVTSEPSITHELDAYFEWKALADSGNE